MSGVIFHEPSRVIGYVEHESETWILKQFLTKEGLRRLEAEYYTIRHLKSLKIPGLNMLKCRYFRDVLLLGPIGVTMYDVFESCSSEVATFMSGCLSQLELLHSGGFVHGDIRPLNIVFVEKRDVYLVDFETCRSVNQVAHYYADIDGFSPDGILNAKSGPGNVLYEPMYDFECLAYAMVFCIEKRLPWKKSSSKADLIHQRGKCMEMYKESVDWLGIAFALLEMSKGKRSNADVETRIRKMTEK